MGIQTTFGGNSLLMDGLILGQHHLSREPLARWAWPSRPSGRPWTWPPRGGGRARRPRATWCSSAPFGWPEANPGGMGGSFWFLGRCFPTWGCLLIYLEGGVPPFWCFLFCFFFFSVPTRVCFYLSVCSDPPPKKIWVKQYMLFVVPTQPRGVFFFLFSPQFFIRFRANRVPFF